MRIQHSNSPIRILHFVGCVNTGGAETWLMHIMRRMDRRRCHFDFFTHTQQAGFYDDEIRSLGGNVFSCTHQSRFLKFLRDFYKILKQNGPYDVVHSHVHYFSGFHVMLARWMGVPMRIVHSHNDTSLNEAHIGWIRKMYLCISKWLIRRYATKGIACSKKAAKSLFGDDWESDPRWHILYCSINLAPFSQAVNRDEMRRSLNIPSDAFVIGHVGRFSEQKNHKFLLDIFVEIAKQDSNALLLLVGDGHLREQMQEKAHRLGLSKKIIFAGVRPDIPQLMLGAMDVFILPSLHEGLPLVLLEAQAANLPCIFSDNITKEVDVARPLMHRMSLGKPASNWADTVLQQRKANPLSKTEAWNMVSQSGFNLETSIHQLEKFYEVETAI